MKTKICIVLLTLLSSVSGQNQSPMAVDSHIMPVNVIDGATHPELIPDAIAFRLYFTAVAPSVKHTTSEQMARRSHRHAIHLSNGDEGVLEKVLGAYQTKFEDLVANYNSDPNRTSRTDVEWQTFQEAQDRLVSEALDTLSTTLTPIGFRLLKAHVKGQKAMMRVAMGANQ